MTMITPSYLGETIEYSSLHACRSTLEDPTCEYPVGESVRGGCADRGFLRPPFGNPALTVIALCSVSAEDGL